MASSLVVVAGTIYVGTLDGVRYAIEAATGEARWRPDLGAALDSSSAVVGGTIYLASLDGSVYAFDGG